MTTGYGVPPYNNESTCTISILCSYSVCLSVCLHVYKCIEMTLRFHIIIVHVTVD